MIHTMDLSFSTLTRRFQFITLASNNVFSMLQHEEIEGNPTFPGVTFLSLGSKPLGKPSWLS